MQLLLDLAERFGRRRDDEGSVDGGRRSVVLTNPRHLVQVWLPYDWK